MQKYHDIRREYGDNSLDEKTVLLEPIAQFKKWFEEVLKIETEDPTAMVLATVDAQNRPDTRILLLKELAQAGFIFYTNYQSEKGKQIALHPFGAINFYWEKCARQVRIRGEIKKISREHSEAYFATRPIGSKLSALASKQSNTIKNRKILEDKMQALQSKYHEKDIPCPDYWGGYILVPNEVEFFQGRDSRLHDRIKYQLVNNEWIIERLSP